MKINNNNFIKYGLVVSLLTIAFSLFYYLVIFLPKKQIAEIKFGESQQQQIESRNSKQETKLRECLQNAATYHDQLLAANNTSGSNNTYTVPAQIGELAKDTYNKMVAECNQLYN